MKSNMDNFTCRAYGRTELALLYNPHLSPEAAYRKLMAWICRYPQLPEALERMGCGHSRTWPPAAVAAIVAALGEP